MASVSSKPDQLVDVKSEENEEVDDATKRSDGDENTVKYSAADVTEENPEEESEDFSIVEEEGIETSREIEESETVEKIDVDSSCTTTIAAYVKDLEDETGIPEEQKKEISDALVPDVSLAKENDDPNAPTGTEVSAAYDLEVQAQEQIRETETQEPSSNGADKGSGYAEAVEKRKGSLEEEIPANPVEPLETNKTEVARSYTDLSAAEVSPDDQGRAPETAEFEIEKEKDVRFEIEKDTIIDESAKDHNIVPEASDVPSKDKKVSSSSDERKIESLEDADTTLVKAPKDLNAVEESPGQIIFEENKNENSNDIEIPKSTAQVLKEIRSTEMIEKKKNDSEDYSMLEKNVQIPDDTKEETQLEGIQTAADKSEEKRLGAEKEETQKSKDADPIVSSDTADTKLIKESIKRESKNLFSMAKRSIAKAKKAILGKSPGPKTVSSEIKDEIS